MNDSVRGYIVSQTKNTFQFSFFHLSHFPLFFPLSATEGVPSVYEQNSQILEIRLFNFPYGMVCKVLIVLAVKTHVNSWLNEVRIFTK